MYTLVPLLFLGLKTNYPPKKEKDCGHKQARPASFIATTIVPSMMDDGTSSVPRLMKKREPDVIGFYFEPLGTKEADIINTKHNTNYNYTNRATRNTTTMNTDFTITLQHSNHANQMTVATSGRSTRCVRCCVCLECFHYESSSSSDHDWLNRIAH